MANIEVNDIHPAGSELFADFESFLNELSNAEMDIRGGGGNACSLLSIACCNGLDGEDPDPDYYGGS